MPEFDDNFTLEEYTLDEDGDDDVFRVGNLDFGVFHDQLSTTSPGVNRNDENEDVEQSLSELHYYRQLKPLFFYNISVDIKKKDMQSIHSKIIASGFDSFFKDVLRDTKESTYRIEATVVRDVDFCPDSFEPVLVEKLLGLVDCSSQELCDAEGIFLVAERVVNKVRSSGFMFDSVDSPLLTSFVAQGSESLLIDEISQSLKRYYSPVLVSSSVSNADVKTLQARSSKLDGVALIIFVPMVFPIVSSTVQPVPNDDHRRNAEAMTSTGIIPSVTRRPPGRPPRGDRAQGNKETYQSVTIEVLFGAQRFGAYGKVGSIMASKVERGGKKICINKATVHDLPITMKTLFEDYLLPIVSLDPPKYGLSRSAVSSGAFTPDKYFISHVDCSSPLPPEFKKGSRTDYSAGPEYWITEGSKGIRELKRISSHHFGLPEDPSEYDHPLEEEQRDIEAPKLRLILADRGIVDSSLGKTASMGDAVQKRWY
jgi:hypothetical protein